jgi:hypothetical protein
MKRLDQYCELRLSTRTTPLVVGACTNWSPPTRIPTCDGPGATVVKNTKSPGSSADGSTDCPTWNCCRASRGIATPCCSNTYFTRPLQSKPAGSTPPFRYGAPRSDSAVDEIEYPSAVVGAAPSGELDVRGGVREAAGPPGSGNGRGTAPLDAQAVVATATRTALRSRGVTSSRIGASCRFVYDALSPCITPV